MNGSIHSVESSMQTLSFIKGTSFDLIPWILKGGIWTLPLFTSFRPFLWWTRIHKVWGQIAIGKVLLEGGQHFLSPVAPADLDFPVVSPVVIENPFARFREDPVASENVVYGLYASNVGRVPAAALVACYSPLLDCKKDKILEDRRDGLEIVYRIMLRLITYEAIISGIDYPQTKMTDVLPVWVLNVLIATGIAEIFSMRTQREPIAKPRIFVQCVRCFQVNREFNGFVTFVDKRPVGIPILAPRWFNPIANRVGKL